MAAVLASGGGLENPFPQVLNEALSYAGGGSVGDSGMLMDRGDMGGRGAAYFLEIKAQPEVREARRDCLCEFWDRLRYRH